MLFCVLVLCPIGCVHIYDGGDTIRCMLHFVAKILNNTVLCPLCRGFCRGFPLKTSQKVLAIGEHSLY